MCESQKLEEEGIKMTLPWIPLDNREVSEPQDTWLRKATNREQNQPKRLKFLESSKLKGVGDLQSALTSDMEMQGLDFAQLTFGHALVQYFLNMMFQNSNVYPLMLEVCDLLFYLISLAITIKKLHESQENGNF